MWKCRSAPGRRTCGANVSEAAATNDLSIKYGGGDANLRQALDTLSEWAKSLDEARKAYLIAVQAFEGIDTAPDVDDATPEGMRQELTGLNLELDRAFSQFELLVQAIAKMVGR